MTSSWLTATVLMMQLSFNDHEITDDFEGMLIENLQIFMNARDSEEMNANNPWIRLMSSEVDENQSFGDEDETARSVPTISSKIVMKVTQKLMVMKMTVSFTINKVV